MFFVKQAIEDGRKCSKTNPVSSFLDKLVVEGHGSTESVARYTDNEDFYYNIFTYKVCDVHKHTQRKRSIIE